MGETESTRTDYRAEDAGNDRNEAELSSVPPYYWSWYRVVFPQRSPSRDDEQHTPAREQR